LYRYTKVYELSDNIKHLASESGWYGRAGHEVGLLHSCSIHLTHSAC
jgi:hypothetical protein